MAVMFYGNIAAVQFIPIGLAALLFFTFPPLINLGEAMLQRRLPAGLRLVYSKMSNTAKRQLILARMRR